VCHGFLCECDEDDVAGPYREFRHGKSYDDPCKKARCYHCSWGGTHPEIPDKAAKIIDSLGDIPIDWEYDESGTHGWIFSVGKLSFFKQTAGSEDEIRGCGIHRIFKTRQEGDDAIRAVIRKQFRDIALLCEPRSC
jgi:hypothetical protein